MQLQEIKVKFLLSIFPLKHFKTSAVKHIDISQFFSPNVIALSFQKGSQAQDRGNLSFTHCVF